MRKRIYVCITARPQYARLKSVLREIDKDPNLELYLDVAGSALLDKYGAIDEIIERDGFFIQDKIYFVTEGDVPLCMANSMANFILALTPILSKIKPDIVLVHADRYEQLSIATAASFLNIPIAHTQGGEITGSIDDRVRNMITQIAKYHFVSTDGSAERVKKFTGSDLIYNVGCPSLDVIKKMSLKFEQDDLPGVGIKIDFNKPYIIVMFHPDTDEYDNTFKQTEIISRAINKLNYQTVWFWPNIDPGNYGIADLLRKYRESGLLNNVRLIKNMNPEDFIRLAYMSIGMIGNSSFGIREGSYLSIPFVCLGSRQNGREHSENTVYCNLNPYDIVMTFKDHIRKSFEPSFLYGTGNSGEQIARLLSSF